MIEIPPSPGSRRGRRLLVCAGILSGVAVAAGVWAHRARARNRLETADAFLGAMSRADHRLAASYLCWTNDPDVAKRAWSRRPARWGQSWALLGPSKSAHDLHMVDYELMGTDGRRRLLRLEYFDSGRLHNVWVDGEQVFLDPRDPLPSEAEPR